MRISNLIVLFLLITARSTGTSDLSDNNTFRKIFNNEEINDLQIIFDFFNENVCDTSANQGLTNCYHDLHIKIDEAKESGEIPFEIAFEKQREAYNEISDSTFKRIWSFGITRFREFPNDTFQSVYINPRGKYMKFLMEVGKENIIVNEYFKKISSTGDVLQYYELQKFLRNKKLNINDIRVKFIIAINILTLNDGINRKDILIK